MDVPKNSLTITKTHAATRQTEAGIEALIRGDFDIAITLAGAAEGMFDRNGPHMFPFLRDSDRVEGIGKKDWIGTLNLERDWLKHVTSDRPNVLVIEPFAAALMIARAASKLENWTPRMFYFKEWLSAHIDKLTSP